MSCRSNLCIASVGVVGATSLLVQGNGKGPEVLEVVGSLTNHVEPDLSLESSEKGCSGIVVRLKFHFEDELIEELGVPVDGSGLLQSSEEPLLGLLLGVHVAPLQLEVFLKGTPVSVVCLGMGGLHLIQLDPLPIGSLPAAQLWGPLDLDGVCWEVCGVQLDVCVTF